MLEQAIPGPCPGHLSDDHWAGIKEATGDVSRVKQIRAVSGPGFMLFSGDDETGVKFVLEGGDGVISVTSNVVREKSPP
jgi:4-hydroxy-tetrahydrodipicolinate synthase